MANFSIGLSGLNAAQSAIDIIGTNIANAATPGYHKKEVELTPAYSSQMGDVFMGGGVQVEDIIRRVDALLEQEILRQNSSLAMLTQELSTLTTIESTFGELSGDGTISLAIDDFFSAVDDLSLHPEDAVRQNHLVNAAENLADQFNRIGVYLSDLQTQMRFESDVLIDEVNKLTSEIASFNDSIVTIEIADGDASTLMDQRDKLVSDLSEIVKIQATQKEHGVVDIIITGFSVVTGSYSNDLEMNTDSLGQYGISTKGNLSTKTEVAGGTLGGLMSLTNDVVSDIMQQFDDLANAFMTQVNSIHAQSVGATGSFTSIAAANTVASNLSEIDGITDGSLFIRVTDTATGTVTRHEITIDKATDTLTDVAASITSIPGLSASLNGDKLNIISDSGYEFDFIPALLPEPYTSNLTVETSVTGFYDGTENKTYTFNVVSSGNVSETSGLSIDVLVDGQPLKNINVGTDYAAGDKIEIENGICISLGSGTLTAGQSFTIEALADSDTSGLLSTLGVNALFTGSGAVDMAVASDIAELPARLAVSQGQDMTDNEGMLKMLEIRDAGIEQLGGLTLGEYNTRLVSDIGQGISIRQMKLENAETMLQDLTEQQADVSGVDINEQAAQMIMYEQMFQAMAKYINTLQTSISSLMEIL